MAQYQTLANATTRSLFIATVAMTWFGTVIPADAQSSVGTIESLPPPPNAGAPPASILEIDPAEQQIANELGYRVLPQGPVHEAFASFSDPASITNPRVYSEKPPADIREQAPNDLAQTDDLLWIPGYWAWDESVEKYVWVSGVYRRMPPGRTWVPGFWSAHGTGYRWTSGYWVEQVGGFSDQAYLPTVPESIENGPSVPPPGEDYFWLPGSWEHAEGGYVWRSGYWTRNYEGWVWQPSCYINTPQGFAYNAGYWDRLPPDRGMLYAPVDFYRPTYMNSGFVYRPQVPLPNAAALLLNLFARRGHQGVFYGDFYGPSYAALGYRPWYEMGYGYDGFGTSFAPWRSYYDWNYGRRGIDFGGSMRRYRNFYDNSRQGVHGSGKFHGDFDNLAGNATLGRGSQDFKSKRSFDDYVVHDFNGQTPPRVNRKPQGSSSLQNSNSKSSRSNEDWDSQGSKKRDSTRSHPKQSTAGGTVENHGDKSRKISKSPQSLDRGPKLRAHDQGGPRPTVERRSAAPRSSNSLGGRSGGSSGKGSRGGGNSGGGNSGKGGGKGNGGKK